ncbi:putative transcriptional regulator [Candidatus Glomeribacter gigasporarum BEG34]|uniref:Putative transcriptional regulator n=2 Tax=Candidatus Glomeribacter gigasporarum TaxID=132144 RepID=G2J8K5_9BURK|nr:putative transcriptional regulator [Candidatus Glomeribacter gigasporarum BEG34]
MGLVLIDERISIRKANPMNTARIPLDLTKLSCGGEFLSNFIESYFEPAHLRDACTRKHLIANFLSAKRGGFESMHDLIGMTPKELWGPDAFQRRDQLNMDPIVASDEIKNVNRMANFEAQALFCRRPVSIHRSILDFNGIAHFQRVLKIPILSSYSNKVVALLTVLQDLTHHLHCSKIFHLYQKFYPIKKAIQKTLEHFKLEKYFCGQPTYHEMRVLLSMREDSRHKVVAKKLECADATVSSHIANLQSKLKSGAVHDVLSQLPSIPENEQDAYIWID